MLTSCAGLLYEELKEPGIALSDYNEALRIDPDDALAYLRRGVIRTSYKHDPDRAIEDFTEAIRLDPHRPRAFAERGHVRRRPGESSTLLSPTTQRPSAWTRTTLSPATAGPSPGRQRGRPIALNDFGAQYGSLPTTPSST